MKKSYLFLWMLFFLFFATLPASANDVFLYEDEGPLTPSPISQEQFDAGLFNQNADGDCASIVSSDFPKIVVNTTFYDSNGTPVSGLTADDFRVTEQSETEAAPTDQALAGFEENVSTLPISLSLVFDVSLSMRSRLADAKIAAENFLNTAQEGDRAALVSFSGCNKERIVSASADVATDADQNGIPDIIEKIRSLTIVNTTAVYDGIAKGIESILQEPIPKGVIVFTDGDTNDDCKFSINDVIQKAIDSGIPIYTIGLDTSDRMSYLLNTIAEKTGGYFQEAPTALDMEALYTNIAQSIRGQYALTYTTHNPAEDGSLRTVTVHYGDQVCVGTYTAPGVWNPNFPAIDHTPIATWQENLAIPVSASVTDPDAGDSVSRVALFYRSSADAPNGSYTSVDLANTAGSAYSATIPADQVTLPGVQYYLTAWDSRGGQSENGTALQPHSIIVTAAPQPPVANAGRDMSVNEGELTILDGSGSMASTPDKALSYAWRQVSGTMVDLSDTAAVKPEFIAPMTGPEGAILVFELKVTDSGDRTGIDTVSITVNDLLAPKADFTWSPASPAAEQSIAFTDASVPGGGDILSWEWDFGGEGISTSQNPEFTFPRSGTYSVRLTVTDEFGSIGNVVKSISVSEPVCIGGDCGGSGGCFIRSAGEDFLRK